jgi:hypothetical protein
LFVNLTELPQVTYLNSSSITNGSWDSEYNREKNRENHDKIIIFLV